jgi:RNA polymerase-binding transcription factor DksA
MTPTAVDDARLRLERRRATLERLLTENAGKQELQRELTETRAALDRIDDGSYGRCATCGGAIGRQRLLAFPAARLCIDCTTASHPPRTT